MDINIVFLMVYYETTIRFIIVFIACIFITSQTVTLYPQTEVDSHDFQKKIRRPNILGSMLCTLALLSAPHSTKIAQKRFNPLLKIVNILSVDGGGARGTVPLTVLSEMERQTGKRVHELFDIVGGPSVACVITSALTSPKDFTQPQWNPLTTEEAYQLMLKEGPEVFAKMRYYPSIYDPTHLENVCKKIFNNTTYDQSIIPRVGFALDLNTYDIKVFSSESAEIFKATDVVLSSTAIPLIFPRRTISSVERDTCFVRKYLLSDWPVEPEMAILNEAKRIFPNAEEFRLLSLGTGYKKEQSNTARLLKALGKNFIRFNPTIIRDSSIIDGRLETLKDLNVQTLNYINLHRAEFNDIINLIETM